MEYKFLCDATTHRLAKWLRFLGQDTLWSREYIPYILLSLAEKEKRIILTRTRDFLSPGKNNVYVLKSDFLFEQLKDVVIHFKIKNPKILSRCSECNTPLVVLDREKVKGRVPYFTYKNHEEFKLCPSCNKIYWKGSHVESMIQRLKKEGIWELMF